MSEGFQTLAQANRAIFFEEKGLRRSIIAAYLVVIVVGIPLWWQLTSITRLPLPTARVNELNWSDSISIPVDLNVHTGGFSAPQPADIAALEQALEERNAHKGVALRLNPTSIDQDSSEHNHLSSLSITFSNVTRVSTPEVGYNAITSDSASLESTVSAVSELLGSNPHSSHQRVVNYSPRYRLAFTLLNEAVSSAGYQEWDVECVITEQIEPVLNQLRALHEFQVESQVVYYAPLAIEPSLQHPNGTQFYALSTKELTMFVNGADWPLASSVSADPVIHFIVFVPAASHHPMHVVDARGEPTRQNAFIIPQWGGITILNPAQTDSASAPALRGEALLAVFSTFKIQLQQLLGVPMLSAKMRGPITDNRPLTQWQLAGLMTRRTHENLRSAVAALRSVTFLVARIAHIPVKDDVRNLVDDALDDLNELQISLSLPPGEAGLSRAFLASRDAAAKADAAFFHRGLLGMLYFPPEHTLAVYAPFVAFVSIPIVKVLLSEWRSAPTTSRTMLRKQS